MKFRCRSLRNFTLRTTSGRHGFRVQAEIYSMEKVLNRLFHHWIISVEIMTTVIWWGGVCVCVSGLICWVWIFEDRGVLYCKRKTPSASQNAISKLQSLPWGKTKLPIALIRWQKLMKKVLRLLKGKNYWWLFSRRHKWLGAFFRASLSRISFLFLLELAYRGSKSLWELFFLPPLTHFKSWAAG